MRRLPALQAHANLTSAVRLGAWWQVALGIITPVVLGWMMWDSLRQEFEQNYADYSTEFLLVMGWGVAIGVVVVGIVLSLFRWRGADDFVPADTETVGGEGRRS